MNDDVADLWRTVAHVAQARAAVLEQGLRALEQDAVDLADRCAVAHVESDKLVGSLDSYGLAGGSALALRASRLFDARSLHGLREVVE